MNIKQIKTNAGNMVLCDVRWSDAKDCSYGECKNYTDVLGAFSCEYTTIDNRDIIMNR